LSNSASAQYYIEYVSRQYGFLGRSSWNDQAFMGEYDLFRVYSVALNQAQVQSLYVQAMGPSPFPSTSSTGSSPSTSQSSSSSAASTIINRSSSSSSTAGSSNGGGSVSSGGGSGLSGGAIAGIVIGSVVGAALLCGICIFVILGGRRSKKASTEGQGDRASGRYNEHDDAISSVGQSTHDDGVEMQETEPETA